MTELLERAFAEAAQLPASEQEAFATWILEELASDRRWAQAFEKSHALLARLADEAILEHHRQQTEPVDADRR